MNMDTVDNTNEENNFPPLSKKEIRELKAAEKALTDAAKLDPKIRPSPKNKNVNRKRLYDAINSSLAEYVDSYMLMGFDTNGKEIVLVNIRSSLEDRALKNLVEDVVGNGMFMSPGNGGLQTDEDDDSDE